MADIRISSPDGEMVLGTYEPDHQTVLAAFEATARDYPEHEFLLVPASAAKAYANGPVSYRYAEALAEIQVLRACYAASGVAPGMRVALLLENRPAFFLHWFALNALGAGVVPVNPDYRLSELGYLMAHSEAVLGVTLADRADDLRQAVRSVGRSTPVVAVEAVGHGLPDLSSATEPDGLPDRMRECALLYTSGTTGQPKGCILSNDYFLRAGMRYINRRGLAQLRRGESRVLTPLPMFHMNAMATTTSGVVMSGGCLIQLDRFHPASWWQDVVETRATGIHYLGVMPAMLLSLPASANDRAHCVEYGTGANVEPKHHAAFEARFGFPLIEGWAMTESGPGAIVSADQEPRHLGRRCFGRVPPTVELRLVDEDGVDVAVGTPGEILVRHAGPDPKRGFFSGYLNDPDATAAGWASGWWHTGDLARFGPDGSLFFVDRRKNLIRRSGENISALEVETLLKPHPVVADIAVIGVPDEIRGEEIMAFIVPAEGYRADAGAAAELVTWCLERAAYFKAPGWLGFVDKLPVTATQKLQRGELKAAAATLFDRGACFDLRSMKRRQTPSDDLETATVASLFRAQADAHPSRIAVQQGERALTYEVLGQRVDRLAHRAPGAGHRPRRPGGDPRGKPAGIYRAGTRRRHARHHRRLPELAPGASRIDSLPGVGHAEAADRFAAVRRPGKRGRPARLRDPGAWERLRSDLG